MRELHVLVPILLVTLAGWIGIARFPRWLRTLFLTVVLILVLGMYIAPTLCGCD